MVHVNGYIRKSNVSYVKRINGKDYNFDSDYMSENVAKKWATLMRQGKILPHKYHVKIVRVQSRFGTIYQLWRHRY